MSENQPRIHSGWVTLWILLIVGANVLGILGYVVVAYLLGTNNTAFNNLTSFLSVLNAPLWVTFIFITIELVSICSAMALFKWRKWGFFALCVTYSVGFLTNNAIGNSLTFPHILVLFVPVVLYLLLRHEWNLLR
jgi:hypothetical protein